MLTDAKGRFVFTNLPASDHFTIGVSKFGYLDGGHGFAFGPGTSGGRVALRDGEWIADVRIPLWRPGVIDGTVVDERGEPAVDVYVRVIKKVSVLGHDEFASGSAGLPVTRTDERGRYRFAGLAPGQYFVEVPSVHASLPRASEMQPPSNSDSSNAPRPPVGLNFDDGERLVVGHFPIPPAAVDGRRFAYPDVFAPGARTLDAATPIDLAAGEERDGADVVLNPVPTFRISGFVDGPPDSWTGLILRLVPKGMERLGLEAATALVGAGGRFTFLNVPAGDYIIDGARAFGSFILPRGPIPATMMINAPGGISQDLDVAPGVLFAMNFLSGGRDDYWARQPVVVDGRDASNVSVIMRPTGVIQGRVIKEVVPNTPAPDVPNVGIQLDPADGSPALGAPGISLDPRVAADDFVVRGLLPGEYFLRTRFGWIVKFISWNGRDYTDSPFDAVETQDTHDVEVVVTNAGATLRGIVRDAQSTAAQEGMVVLFPTVPARWTNVGLNSPRIRLVDVAHGGQFEIKNIPAGDYNVIAVPGPAAKLRLGPEFFAAANALATRVSLSWGRTDSITLVVRNQAR